MSYLPWYMHLPYGILPLRMCTRKRISSPENVHKSHIEMTIFSGILSSILSLFLTRIDKWAKKNEGKKIRYEQEKDAWGVQDEWENEVQTKGKTP